MQTIPDGAMPEAKANVNKRARIDDANQVRTMRMFLVSFELVLLKTVIVYRCDGTTSADSFCLVEMILLTNFLKGQKASVNKGNIKFESI